MEISGAVFSSTNTTLLLFVLFLDLLILTSGLGLICGAFFSGSDFTGFGSTTSKSKLSGAILFGVVQSEFMEVIEITDNWR